MNDQIQKNAIELRRQGNSYADIAKTLKVSRTSIFNWVKNVRLTESEKQLLEKKVEDKRSRGKLQASITKRAQKVYKEKSAYEKAEKNFEKYSKDPLFMLGIGILTLGKVGKIERQVQFTSADPKLMAICLQWIEKFLGIKKKDLSFRLSIPKNHINSQFTEYWCKTLSITENNFQKNLILSQNNTIDIKNYHGSLSFTISRIEAIRSLIAWQKLTMLYYS